MPKKAVKITEGHVTQEFVWNEEASVWECVKQKFTASNDNVTWEDEQGNDMDDPEGEPAPGGIVSYEDYFTYDMVQPGLVDNLVMTCHSLNAAVIGSWQPNKEGLSEMLENLEDTLRLLGQSSVEYEDTP